jgi:AhpC/TSA family
MSRELKIGAAAPVFHATAVGGEYGAGREVSLADFGGTMLVLYFYPKDDTPGCTAQACGLRDAWGEIEDRAAVFGVSVDPPESHTRFIRTHLINRDGCVAGDLALWQGARRENILYGSLSDEQRRRGGENPATLRAEFWRAAGGVAPQSQNTSAMLLRRALPAARQNSAPQSLFMRWVLRSFSSLFLSFLIPKRKWLKRTVFGWRRICMAGNTWAWSGRRS